MKKLLIVSFLCLLILMGCAPKTSDASSEPDYPKVENPKEVYDAAAAKVRDATYLQVTQEEVLYIEENDHTFGRTYDFYKSGDCWYHTAVDWELPEPKPEDTIYEKTHWLSIDGNVYSMVTGDGWPNPKWEAVNLEEVNIPLSTEPNYFIFTPRDPKDISGIMKDGKSVISFTAEDFSDFWGRDLTSTYVTVTIGETGMIETVEYTYQIERVPGHPMNYQFVNRLLSLDVKEDVAIIEEQIPLLPQ